MLLQLPRLAPHLARHMGALARLGIREAGDEARFYAKNAGKLAAAGVAGVLGLVMALVWILAAVWDTGYRELTAGLLTGVLLLVAAALVAGARRDAAVHKPFQRTARELDSDRHLYAELRPERSATPPPQPEQVLAESRIEIRRVTGHGRRGPAATTRRVDAPPPSLPDTAAAGAYRFAAGDGPRHAAFPRSRTMRMLVRGGPAGSAAAVAWLLRRPRGGDWRRV